jgi:hypothetical protein
VSMKASDEQHRSLLTITSNLEKQALALHQWSNIYLHNQNRENFLATFNLVRQVKKSAEETQDLLSVWRYKD